VGRGIRKMKKKISLNALKKMSALSTINPKKFTFHFPFIIPVSVAAIRSGKPGLHNMEL